MRKPNTTPGGRAARTRAAGDASPPRGATGRGRPTDASRGRARPVADVAGDASRAAARSVAAAGGNASRGGTARQGQAGGRARSPAKAAAAKANGKRGGRPPATLPPEVLERLGPVPTTPKELRLWLTRASAELWTLEASGGLAGAFAFRLRSGLQLIDRVMPKNEDQIPPQETPPPPPASDDGEQRGDAPREALSDADQAIAVA